MSNERWSYSCGDAMAMVFFRSDAIPMFYATRYHRFSCNLSLDLNITDDIFQCYGFSQFLVGFMIFQGIFLDSWFFKEYSFSLFKLNHDQR